MINKLRVNGLNEDLKTVYQCNLSDLLDFAPRDAQTCSSIERIQRGYIGVIDISTPEVHFLAKGIKKDPQDLIFSLLTQIYKQMMDWNQKRVYRNVESN